jgi:Fe-S oxidoreductase
VEIPLPNLILDVRHRTVEAKGLPLVKRLIFGLMAHPRLFDFVARLLSIAQWPVTRGSQYVRARNLRPFRRLFERLPIIGSVISYIAALTLWRSLPSFAVQPLRDRVKSRVSMPEKGLNLTVCYFAGCMTDRLYPEMGEAVIKVLEAVGVHVVFPQEQNCCGLPALNSGDRRDGVAMARQTIVALERSLAESKADYILSASTSCVVTIIRDYIRLFEDLHYAGWLRRARALAEKVIDFTHFMDQIVLPSGVELPLRSQDIPATVVTYHDSCQSCNCLGLRAEARRVLRDVLHCDLREMPSSDVCCGFGGSTSMEHPEVAERILNEKLNNAEGTGATVLLADNPGCLMHLRGGVDASNRPLRVVHLAQLIAERLP